MSGNIKSEIETITQKLNEHRQEIGLLKVNTDEVDVVLSMTRQQLHMLDNKERALYAFVIAKYAYNMKLKENRYSAIVNWIDALMNRLTATESSKYCDIKFTKFPEQKELVLVNNDYGIALARAKREFKLYLDDVKEISRNIDYIGRALKEIKDEKR